MSPGVKPVRPSGVGTAWSDSMPTLTAQADFEDPGGGAPIVHARTSDGRPYTLRPGERVTITITRPARPRRGPPPNAAY